MKIWVLRPDGQMRVERVRLGGEGDPDLAGGRPPRRARRRAGRRPCANRASARAAARGASGDIADGRWTWSPLLGRRHQAPVRRPLTSMMTLRKRLVADVAEGVPQGALVPAHDRSRGHLDPVDRAVAVRPLDHVTLDRRSRCSRGGECASRPLARGEVDAPDAHALVLEHQLGSDRVALRIGLVHRAPPDWPGDAGSGAVAPPRPRCGKRSTTERPSRQDIPIEARPRSLQSRSSAADVPRAAPPGDPT